MIITALEVYCGSAYAQEDVVIDSVRAYAQKDLGCQRLLFFRCYVASQALPMLCHTIRRGWVGSHQRDNVSETNI